MFPRQSLLAPFRYLILLSLLKLISSYSTNETTSEEMGKNALSHCALGSLCVRKCCPKDAVFVSSFKCISTSDLEISEWEPSSSVSKGNITMTYGIPAADPNHICAMEGKGKYYLQDNGKIRQLEKKKNYSVDYYCIDNIYNETSKSLTEFAVICSKIIRKTQFHLIADVIQRGALSASVCVIVFLLLLNYLSQEKLSLHMKCILSSCFSLLIAYVLAIMNMTHSVTRDLPQVPCIALGIGLQFFLLCYCFWLTGVYFNLIYMLRSQGMLKNEKEEKGPCYYYFALYSFGCPAIISITTVVIHNLPFESTSLIKPRIADGRCWFQDGSSMYAYYYGIEAFLNIVSIVLMFYAWRLHSSGGLKVAQFRLTVWLFMFSTGYWLLNVTTLSSPDAEFWRVIDIFLSLYGFVLFFVITYFERHLYKDFQVALRNGISYITCSKISRHAEKKIIFY